jgi:predicted NBD/HSP70 family sugar kinase
MAYLVFDIGGTKTRVAMSNDLKEFVDHKSFKTPVKPEDGIKKIITAAEELCSTCEVEAIAGGIRGILNEEKTAMENDGVLTQWAGYPIVEKLQAAFKCPVFLENDAAIAGVGEAVFGAGKGLDIVAYHTVSTGVGGAKIEHGEIDESSIGFEPGRQILDIDRTVLGAEIEPTLENLVSGTAVGERFNCKAYEIPQSDALWDELAEYLAQGLRNTILYWSPDAIVLGGSMIIGDPRIEIDPIRKYTVEALDGFVEAPLIAKAKLGDEAGLYGGLGILKKRL